MAQQNEPHLAAAAPRGRPAAPERSSGSIGAATVDPDGPWAPGDPADLAGMVAYLQELFGQMMTAAMADVDDAALVEEWVSGRMVPSPAAARRIRAVFAVASLLRQSESAQTVQVWFMGMNPDLDDRAPALVIADDPARVLDAARAFLAHG